jgi:hypothetical protein
VVARRGRIGFATQLITFSALPRTPVSNRAIGVELAAAREDSRTSGQPARQFNELI